MTSPSASSFDEADLQFADQALAETDALLVSAYPGDDGSRQPIHTVYIPGDRYEAGIAGRWGAEALSAVDGFGGIDRLVAELGIDAAEQATIAERVREKLTAEPIEDLRIDFEDGFGDRGDEAEDAAVVAAASALADDLAAGTAPPFFGIRFKCFESDTRRRGIRTLDLFLTTLVGALGTDLPSGLILTLPKVTTVQQVEVMVRLLERLEERLGLAPRRLGFEVQVETPQLIIGAGGTFPVAELLHRADGRITGLHYGTYDYSASLGIAAAQQSMEHPAADFAKQVMQVAVAGTGVRVSDGSTNVIPAGDGALDAWKLHARLVRRSLERAYYQGWDLHPAHLPSRFVASYAFFRTGVEAVTRRLRNYVEQNTDGFLDEPATARALAGFLVRGVQSGAVSASELASSVGVSEADLVALAYPRRG